MKLQQLLGIELPLIQAPMAGVQGSALTLAVSGTGALGSLPCAMLTPELLLEELHTLTKAGRAYNLNFFCHAPPNPDPAREARWRAALAPYFAEFGIDPTQVPTGGGRAPFSPGIADLIEPFKPPVLSFHFGLPPPQLLARAKAWGARVLGNATTVDEARWLEAHGVDAIIAQGLEAGGHRGHFLSHDLTRQMGTFALVPQVVRAVKVPVIAAGGIAEPGHIAAAFSLGASAVQIGTAYLLCPEATTTTLHRAALKDPTRREHTALTQLITGRPARGLLNRLMKELGPLGDAQPEFPLATAALAPLKAAAEKLGRDDFSTLWSGQNASSCREMPAADLTRWLLSAMQR